MFQVLERMRRRGRTIERVHERVASNSGSGTTSGYGNSVSSCQIANWAETEYLPAARGW